MASLGTVHSSCDTPVSCIHFHISPCPSASSVVSCCTTTRQETSKLTQELDALYNDYKTLDEQYLVIQKRNNDLERRCERAEALIGDLGKGRKEFGDSSIDLVESGNQYLSNKTRQDLVSSNKTVQNDVPESVPYPQQVWTDVEGVISRLEAENMHLKARFQQAIMLAALWENRWFSSETKKQTLQQKLDVLTQDHLGDDMGWNWDSDEETEKEELEAVLPRFHHVVSQKTECQKCRLFMDDVNSDPCLFHPLPPLSLSEWLTLFPEADQKFIAANKDRKYWRCCRKLSKNRPQGCTVGSHDFQPK